jgi:hypothetical protein
MPNRSDPSRHAELVAVIREVRRRWRLKVLLRGGAVVAVAAVLAVLASAFAIEQFGFATGAVLAMRVLLGAVVIALVARYVVQPMLRTVDDARVALYLEEHEPTLQAAVLSGLEAGDAELTVRTGLSPVLASRTVEDAIERCRAIDFGRRIERPEINRFATVLATAAVAGLVMALFSPGFLRHGTEALLLRPADAANPFRVSVEPGSVTIPRGADQAIHARTVGFDAAGAEVAFRRAGEDGFRRLPMTADPAGGFEVLLFDITDATEYFVESNGVRSPVYRIDVADLPYVATLRLEYRFPAYTGLPPRVVEEGGDIAVLAGTRVIVHATPTVPVEAGALVVDGARIAMTSDGAGGVTGEMHVERDGFYHIEFPGRDGRPLNGSPQYTIDVLADLPPVVRIAQPGRDTRVTPIEEVFIEARAEDDYGIAALELVYAVNGGEERTVALYRAATGLREVTAGHTLHLEELDLEPGDLVSYYARVRDNAPGAAGTTATSDIYFLSIRPFGQTYRQAQQPPGDGGGGGGGGEDGQLSDRQREIVAATFNLLRDSASTRADDLAENVVTVALAQERLKEQAETLAERMRNRGVTTDTAFALIARLLPEAAREMGAAAESLRRGRLTDALQPEQRALRILQQAEAVFREVQVSFQQQAGGGGGGSPMAQDLADLFELELDKLRNQYETVQRGQREQGQDAVDEARERLRELARRQQAEAERLRRLQQAGGQGGGGSADQQRQLADETEQAARQLERLARETQQPQLQETARRLQEAADAMRRAAANARAGTGAADAAQALDRLEDAQRRLQRSQSDQLAERASSALQRAEELARQQDQIARQMEALAGTSGAARGEAARRLIERKDQQGADLANLEREIDRMAQEARTSDRDAARRLQEASNAIRDEQLKEKIRYSRALTQPGADPDYSRELEAEIGRGLEELRDRLGAAARSLAESARGGTASDRLAQARDLARALESMEERARQAQERAAQRRLGERAEAQGGERAEARGGEQQGQQGQQGHQGQQGQQGGQGGPGGWVQGGVPMGPGGGGDSRVGPMGPDDVRQFRAEARQRLAEAERLRRELQREGLETAELDAVIADLRRLDVERVYGDPLEFTRLQMAVVDGIKQFEYNLRRQVLGAERERLLSTGSGDVPEAYRRLVEEYYRSLSRDGNR